MNTGGSFASIPSAPANRVSYALGITGPPVQPDTACNSSLTALHLAILAIEAGDCSAALVGAAQINREYVQFVANFIDLNASQSGRMEELLPQ
jgi:acyl transferase domain-containing protein